MKISIITISNAEVISSKKNNSINQICSSLYKNKQDVLYCQTIKANSSVLKNSLDSALEISDCVILICQNEWDTFYMTKKIICDVFSTQMEVSDYAKTNIEEFSSTKNIPLRKEDFSCMQMPKIARTIKNPFSVFQGCLCQNNDKTIFLLPLQYDELYHIFFSSVMPFILDLNSENSKTFILKTFGITLSDLSHLLRDQIKNKYNIEVVCNEYLQSGEVVIKVPKGVRSEVYDKLVNNVYTKLLPYVYSEKDESQAELICSILKMRNMTISFAEDFTAGNMCAELYKNSSDARDVVGEVYITPSNKSKSKLLGVDEATFRKSSIDYTDISYQMALGVLENSGADVVVANCGDFETGDCVFAIGNKEGIHVFSQNVSGSPEQKIKMASGMIFFQLIKKLKQNDFYLGKTTI